MQNSSSAPERGTVITRHGQNLVVEADSDDQLYHCLFRQSIGHAVCGDHVVWEKTGDSSGVVTAILDRKTVLTRPVFSGEEKPLAANITQMVVVLAPSPEPSEYLLDQYLVAAERFRLKALICINKTDQLDRDGHRNMEQRFSYYASMDYPLVMVSAHLADGLQPLIRQMLDETSIFVGQSGVGKSSLANNLIPDLDLQTQQLSLHSNMGQHTTSATTLYHLPEAGYLIDSPGVRSFRLGSITPDQLENGFRDLRQYFGHCQFSNCRHETEPGCALLQALNDGLIQSSRFTNYQHMRTEIHQDH